MAAAGSALKYRFLLQELVKKGIRLKYRRSYLGVVWSLIEPILTTIVLVIVFGTLFNNKNPTYPLYIIIGRLMYSFFSTGTKGASGSVRANSGMITKVYVPKILYPLSSVLFNFVISCISLIVVFGVQVYCHVLPTWHLLQFIPSLGLLLLLTFGVGLILCTLNVYFRDIEYLWNVVLLLIMYMSAIFYYPERLLSSKYGVILTMNPLFQIIDLSRGAFLGLPWSWHSAGVAFCWGIATCGLGMLIFNRKQDSFILHL